MSTRTQTADILVETGLGSLAMVTPMTAAGRKWIDDNVASESWQWLARPSASMCGIWATSWKGCKRPA